MVKGPPVIHVIRTNAGNSLRFEFQTTGPENIAVSSTNNSDEETTDNKHPNKYLAFTAVNENEKADVVNENNISAVIARIENRASFSVSYFNSPEKSLVVSSSNNDEKSATPSKIFELFKITWKNLDLPKGQREEDLIIELPNPMAPKTLAPQEVVLKKMKVVAMSEKDADQEEVLVDKQVFVGDWNLALTKINRMLKFFEKEENGDVQKFFISSTSGFPQTKAKLGEAIVQMLDGSLEK